MTVAFEMKKEKADFIKKYMESYVETDNESNISGYSIVKVHVKSGLILKLLFDIGELYGQELEKNKQ